MTSYSYQATDSSGKMVTGIIEAENREKVIEELQKERYFPISVEPQKAKSSFSIDISFKRKPISEKELVNFTRQMTTLLRSGMELDKSLSILLELTEKEKAKDVISEIQKAVHSGEALGEALSKHPEVFSPLYLNMVRAGEAGGFLEKIFDRLAWYLENKKKMTESVQSAMIYPGVILLTGIGALLVLTTYVIPRFGAIFENAGGELPLSTRFLLSASQFFLDYWMIMAIGCVAIIMLLKSYLSTEQGKLTRDSLLLKTPLLGSLIQKSAVAQFTRTLGTLLQSGVPIIKAMAIVKDTISNKLIANAVTKTAMAVKEGKKMSAVLKESGLFPPLATHMMMVGEESGQMDEMMLRMAHIYDEEVEIAVKRVLTIFEPAMILVMGIAVAFVVVSMLSAIISLNDLPF